MGRPPLTYKGAGARGPRTGGSGVTFFAALARLAAPGDFLFNPRLSTGSRFEHEEP